MSAGRRSSHAAGTRSSFEHRNARCLCRIPSSAAAPRRGGRPGRARSPGSRRRRRRSRGGSMASSRSMSPVISSVWSRLVGRSGRAAAPRRARRSTPRTARSSGTRGRVRRRARDRCRDDSASPSRRTTRARRLADVGLEVRVELVRDRQPRVERERAAERLLGARLAVGRRRRCTCRSPDGSGRDAPTPARSRDRARGTARTGRARRGSPS